MSSGKEQTKKGIPSVARLEVTAAVQDSNSQRTDKAEAHEELSGHRKSHHQPEPEEGSRIDEESMTEEIDIDRFFKSKEPSETDPE
ncbi:hypothetical protein BKA69DRAFT_1128474 [Paraphysoderma sedebokerense]|nr:hypothetical protein BKA69DRAFT_1128474 [Paraphysoderma sedebokerense]